MAWQSATTLSLMFHDDIILDLADDEGAGDITNVAVAAVITAAIAAASGEVKAELATLYPTECTAETSDPVINEIVGLLTIRWLYGRRPGVGISIDIANRIERAMKNLERIRTGDYTPPTWGAVADSDVCGYGSHLYTETKIFPEFEADMELIDE